ncbi:MAG: DNA repair protein RecO [Clostridia bacterium]|nr:DNA repair protein RecO [Clostridia bacterium]
MRLVKVKGIVIKEIPYKENDKIITVLTDELGKISCIAKGAKKTNSSLLACSQYLVYSEFILYKGTNFYHVNSATVIDTFYNLRIDFESLNIAFEITRLLQTTTDENQDTSQITKLFLNTLFLIQNKSIDIKLVVAVFKIKLCTLLGFSPNTLKCLRCGFKFDIKKVEESDKEKLNTIYYDYVSNMFLCADCVDKNEMKRYISISYNTLIAINYVILSDIKKIFSFKLGTVSFREFIVFAQTYTDTMTTGI